MVKKRGRRRALQVVVAVPSAAAGRRIGQALLEMRLAGCVQTLGPVTSRYRWKGKIESAREWLLLVKTRAAHQAALRREVRRLHPYEVPEILSLPAVGSHAAYLDWLWRETTRPAPRRTTRQTASGR